MFYHTLMLWRGYPSHTAVKIHTRSTSSAKCELDRLALMTVGQAHPTWSPFSPISCLELVSRSCSSLPPIINFIIYLTLCWDPTSQTSPLPRGLKSDYIAWISNLVNCKGSKNTRFVLITVRNALEYKSTTNVKLWFTSLLNPLSTSYYLPEEVSVTVEWRFHRLLTAHLFGWRLSSSVIILVYYADMVDKALSLK